MEYASLNLAIRRNVTNHVRKMPPEHNFCSTHGICSAPFRCHGFANRRITRDKNCSGARLGSRETCASESAVSIKSANYQIVGGDHCKVGPEFDAAPRSFSIHPPYLLAGKILAVLDQATASVLSWCASCIKSVTKRGFTILVHPGDWFDVIPKT